MKALKLLQYSSCIMVIVIVAVGLSICIFRPQLMTVFSSLCGSLLPFIAPQIAAAFTGKHLGQYMQDRPKIAAIKNGHGNEK